LIALGGLFLLLQVLSVVGAGCSDSSLSPSVPQGVRIVRLLAEPETIRAGERTTLRWQIEGASSATLSTGTGVIEKTLAGDAVGAGMLEVRPVRSTVYVLDAVRRSPSGAVLHEARAEITVEVNARPARPSVTLEVSAAAVVPGQSVRLSWTSSHAESIQLLANQVPIAIEGKQVGADTIRVTPDLSTLYRVIVTGPGGQARDEVSVEVAAPPRIVAFQASADEVLEGGSVALTWQVEGAAVLTLTANDQPVPLAGRNPTGDRLELSPGVDTRYRLLAQNDDGEAEETVEVAVLARPRVVAFAPDRETLAPGEQTTLRWEVSGADAVMLLAEGEPVEEVGSAAMGEHVVRPDHTTTYRLLASGPGGEAAAESQVQVLEAVIIDRFEVAPPRVGLGESVTLRWETSGAEQVRLADGTGHTLDLDPAAVDGELVVVPPGTTSYRLEAVGAAGSTSAVVRVTVDTGTAILDFSARPEAIAVGGEAVLAWQTVNTTQVELVAEPGGPLPIDALSPRGDTLVVHPDVTTTYTLRALGRTATVTATAAVHVFREVTITSFAADESIVDPGDPITVRWQTLNAATTQLRYADQVVDVEPNDGLVVEGVTSTTTFYLVAEGVGGPTQAAVTVQVGVPPRIDSFDVDPAEGAAGSARTLSWRVEGARQLTLVADTATQEPVALELVGNQLRRGELALAPEVTTTWRLVAQNASGVESAEVIGHVVAPPSILSFVAEPDTVDLGQEASLRWETANAVAGWVRWEDELGQAGEIALEPGDVEAPLAPYHLALDATTTFTLVVSSSIGPDAEATARVAVSDAGRIVGFGPDVDAVAIDAITSLRWQTRLSTSVTITALDDRGEVVATWEGLESEGAVEVGPVRSPLRFELAVKVGGRTAETAEASLGLRGGDPAALRLTEVSHDADGQWIELRNGSAEAISLWDVELGYGPSSFGGVRVPLRGVAEPGACMVIGLGAVGPVDGALLLEDAPPLPQPVDGAAVGVALWDVGRPLVPVQALVYGERVDADDRFDVGVVRLLEPMVSAASAGGSLTWLPVDPRRRNDFIADSVLAPGWFVNPTPSPGRCFGLAFDPGYGEEVGDPARWPGLLVGRPSGPAAGGAEVALAGWFPDAGARVWFGDAPAVCVQDDFVLACLVPPGPPGRVDLVIEGRGGELTYDAFYTYEDVDACALVSPVHVGPLAGGPRDAVAIEGTPLVYSADVRIAGQTGTPQPDPDIEAQWGFGPWGTDPAYATSAWAWWDAFYAEAPAPETHRYTTAEAVPTPAGRWSHAYRFRRSPQGPWTYCDADGTFNVDVPPTNLFDIAEAGVIDVPL